MVEPVQQFYESQRLRLSYWTWGDEGKPPMLLVHGNRDHARSWDEIANAFCDQYRVVAIDLRGHGDSEWSKGSLYGLPEYVLDILGLIDVLGGKVTLVCHSMGGRASLIAAGAFPERFHKIVGIEATGQLRKELPRGPERIRTWAERAKAREGSEARVYPTLGDAAARVQEANPRFSAPAAEHFARWATREVEGGYVWKYDPALQNNPDLEVPYSEYELFYANLNVPILHVLSSEGEAARGYRHGRPIASFFPDARSVNAPDSGHWIHIDQPAFVIDAMRDFLGNPPAAPRVD